MNTPTTLPTEFIEKVKQILPSDELERFLQVSTQPLKRSIRFNSLKSTQQDMRLVSNRHNWKLEQIPWCPQGAWIEYQHQAPLGNFAEHLTGQFYIQEASSMMPPIALKYAMGAAKLGSVLDMAAAPGSKTTQLAALMNNEGALVANEFSASRIKGLYANLVRCGVTNTALTHYDGRVFGEYLPEAFDAILLDAPCSGEGTFRKDPDAFKNWSQRAVDELSQTQRDLIDSAYKALKPGGKLVYSTCTLNLEENQHVCAYLLQKYPDMAVVNLSELFVGAERSATNEGYLHIWPHHYDSEGFFVAAFSKAEKEMTEKNSFSKPMPAKFPFTKASKKQQQEILQYLAYFGELDISDSSFWLREREVWLFPNKLTELVPLMKFDRIGVKVGEQHKKELRVTHEFAIAYGHQAAQKLDLTAEQAEAFFMGKDLSNSSNYKKGDLVCCYAGVALGLARITGNKLKNKLPRELVRDQGLTFN
ncbi:16S rRNA (cytosine(1407)-C(5))-methyltransferase RsmF [Corallincola platygyrae]|uniref:16S rRNA (Cytosine(1407)-C(5))-methyltransferase RsmF n=1 Tax=Corallincola platygyrae TaxID=1193278 RepID=A0ABW4XJS8_9GAMM